MKCGRFKPSEKLDLTLRFSDEKTFRGLITFFSLSLFCVREGEGSKVGGKGSFIEHASKFLHLV